MKTSLAQILWKKELNYWKRVGAMFDRFNGWLNKATFGIIVVILVSIGHYAFALMHTLYECFLFVVANKMFKENLQKMALKV